MRVNQLIYFYGHIEEIIEKEKLDFLKKSNRIPLSDQQKGIDRARKIVDIAPDWIPAFYSNKRLSLWHGAVSWFAEHESHIPIVFLQLRKGFQNSTFLQYHREELLAHEFIHIGRCTFGNSRYDEVFAYLAAKSAFRRFFGPLFKNNMETYLFVIVMCIVLMCNFILLINPMLKNIFLIAYSSYFLFLGILGYFFIRLFHLQYTFRKCLKKLMSIFKNGSNAYSTMYRLTDEEILLFSKEESIIKYANSQKDISLRWRLIYLTYFQKLSR